MGFFSSLFKPKAQVPDWANFFSPADYARFNELVVADFAQRGNQVTIHDGVVHISGRDGELGLQNLAQICHQYGAPEQWPPVIRGHFDKLEKSMAALEDMRCNMDDFAKVAPFLTVRLYPVQDMDQEMADKLVSRVDLEGTRSVLVIDMPDTILSVDREMAAAWNRPDEELFATALEWLHRDDSTETGEVDLGSLPVMLVAGDGFYVASRALMLHEQPEMHGAHGTLVAVPHRHSLIAYPIEGIAVIKAIQQLIPAVAGAHKEGPGSISSDLFWYKDGSFTRLPVTRTGKTFSFTPPLAFQRLLERLAHVEA